MAEANELHGYHSTESITVVIPVRNGSRHFQRLTRHLACLRARIGLEFLVIDSGSDDVLPAAPDWPLRFAAALEVPIPEEADYSEEQIWARKALAAGYRVVYEPGAEALHAHTYRLRGVFRRSFFVGRALRGDGIDRGASFVESVKYLAGEIGYFIRQGQVHRLPQLLPYEFLRWLGFHAGRLSGGRGASTVGWLAGREAVEPENGPT